VYECFCLHCVQDATLPYVQRIVATSRNKANRSLGFLEPWQIAACAVCFTLIVVWTFEFLFGRDESTCCLYAIQNQHCSRQTTHIDTTVFNHHFPDKPGLVGYQLENLNRVCKLFPSFPHFWCYISQVRLITLSVRILYCLLLLLFIII